MHHAKGQMTYAEAKEQALRWRWLRSYLCCAYCGKLLSWRWKWQGHQFRAVREVPLGYLDAFDRHRLIKGACQCEAIGGHPQAVKSP